MDYEKAYKDAIESIKKIYDQADSYGKELMEKEFPELRESEDERIRKELIEHIKANCESDFILFQKFSPDEVIAWLEKQGERKQKQYDIDVLEKHITKDSISELAHAVIVRNGWEIVDAKEQNHAWSEEDESMLKDAIEFIDTGWTFRGKSHLVYWLKSIKNRIQPQ